MKRLRQLSLWIVWSPWLVVACALMLSAFVLYTGIVNARREGEYVTRLMESRGAALIGTLEAALRTGMGFHWSDEEFKDILDKTGQQPDIQQMIIASPSGVVLAARDAELTGSPVMPAAELSSLAPDATLRHVLRGDQFWVYRQLSVPEFDERLRMYGHGGGMGRGMRDDRGMGMGRGRMMAPSHHMDRPDGPDGADGKTGADRTTMQPTTTPVLALVAFDASPILEAMKADKGHTSIIAAVLIFVGIVGALTFFLIQAYRHSRRLVQETTAFSSNVIRTLPVGILAVDPAGVVTSMNPEAERIVGGNRVGAELAVVLPEAWPALCPALESGQSVREQESRCLVNERRVPLSLSASPIVTEDGQLMGHALIVRDLGEIRRLQAELRHSERLAALGNMAAGIAHEIRNPLGAIKGLVRFFEEASPEASEESRVAGIMTREVARLDKVVGELLDFARPDTLHRAPILLPVLINRVQRLIQSDLDARHIAFRVELPEGLSKSGSEIVVDADRLTQVLLNLCVNAIHAITENIENRANFDDFDTVDIPQGELVIHAAIDAEGLVLEVRDNGVGMTPEVQASMFSPYFTTKTQGTGLGLSISHKIVEAHGGRLQVESVQGKGTSFIVRLPLE